MTVKTHEEQQRLSQHSDRLSYYRDKWARQRDCATRYLTPPFAPFKSEGAANILGKWWLTLPPHLLHFRTELSVNGGAVQGHVNTLLIY